MYRLAKVLYERFGLYRMASVFPFTIENRYPIKHNEIVKEEGVITECWVLSAVNPVFFFGGGGGGGGSQRFPDTTPHLYRSDGMLLVTCGWSPSGYYCTLPPVVQSIVLVFTVYISPMVGCRSYYRSVGSL